MTADSLHSASRLYRWLPTLVLTIAVTLPAVYAQQQLPPECGTLENAYGPFDYTNPTHFKEKLPIVEQLHFDGKVESLKAGINQPLPGADIDYTLRAFPNHHRALNSMARYHLRYSNSIKPPNVNYSAECYFRRAIAFAPEDGIVRLVYGIYLFKQGKTERAVNALHDAKSLMPDSAEVYYNLGLIHTEAKNFPEALAAAWKAYELGFPLPGLRNKLIRAGHWREPPEQAANTQ